MLFAALLGCTGVLLSTAGTRAQTVLNVTAMSQPVTVDGNMSEWKDISAISVPLTGKGKVDSVDLKAAIHGDMIYLLAVWNDDSENILHKPYKWDEAKQSYQRTKQLEDRFAVSLAMSGSFSASKQDGSTFTADVWHWKASRTNPTGLAHDKRHVVSAEKPAGKSKKLKTPDGKIVYVQRPSDAGDKLYKSTKYDVKQEDIMPRYLVTENPTGSITDIKAKGIWKDGKWVLELARKLNTGHDDDAVIPTSGSIEIAVAAFNNVDGRNHSTSEKITLKTGN